tara:strand:- start:64 stop:657 length:594 start_codon:yes stop_codon:yes gene_type:complete
MISKKIIRIYLKNLSILKIWRMNNIMSKKMIVEWDEYKNTVEKLAILIHKEYNPTVLIGIMRGAAPIIDILSRILKLPIAYIVIQSYSGKGMEDKQGKLMFAREISSLASDKDFKNVLLIDDLSDTGLTLNKSIEWLKNYGPTKKFIKEVKTACLWKKKSSSFEPDFCPVRLDSDPWIVQPTEHYEELSIDEIMKRN